MSETYNDLLSIKEASAALGLSRPQFYRLKTSLKPPEVKVGYRTFFRPEDVEAMRRQREGKGS